MGNSEWTIVYILGGIIALIILINVIGILFPPQRPPPITAHRERTAHKQPPLPAAAVAAIIQHPVTATLDADLCKKYPIIDTAYKNGYRFVSYDPLVMELRG